MLQCLHTRKRVDNKKSKKEGINKMATKKANATKTTAKTAKVTEKVTSRTPVEGIQIESGVEIPKSKKSGVWNFLRDMEVGQSFLLEGEDAKLKVRQAYQSALKTHGIKLVYREVENGFRVWRTA